MKRQHIDAFGRKRARDYVRVFREVADGNALVRVQWREPRPSGRPRLRTESFDDTRKGVTEARAFAQGKHESLGEPTTPALAPLPVRALFEAYVTAKGDTWRGNTLRNKRERWGRFELFFGRDTNAHTARRETLDGLKRALLQLGHAPNQVKQTIDEVRRVYRFGVDRELIPATRVVDYRVEFSRDAKRQGPKMAEFSLEERMRIVDAFDPRNPQQWRPWALTTLFAFCGPRQNAARHLEWRDVDFDGDRLHWRPELDKMGADRWQPMPAPVRDALRVAYGWRCAEGYTGRFVFFGVQRRTRGQALPRRDQHHARTRTSLDGVSVNEKPYTYQAYMQQLHDACDRAGVERARFQGAHAFRRGIAGDVFDATGSEKSAAEWIGDKSVKVVNDRYLLDRDERLRKTADLVGGGKS